MYVTDGMLFVIFQVLDGRCL